MKLVLFVRGVVENVNVEPPLLVVGTMIGVVVDEMLKSELTPVVAPLLPETEIVHMIGLPARWGLPVAHDNVDAVLGLP